MRNGPSDQEGPFTFVTTYEMKNGFLLIETFRKLKLWPPGIFSLVALFFVCEGNLTASSWMIML
jgi:hypothetical protein